MIPLKPQVAPQALEPFGGRLLLQGDTRLKPLTQCLRQGRPFRFEVDKDGRQILVYGPRIRELIPPSLRDDG